MTTDTAAAVAIDAAAKELRLPAIRDNAGRLGEEAQRAKSTYLGFLAEALTIEVDDRAERRRQRRIHEARFPRIKRLADFNLDAAPTINPATIATLAAGNYLDAGDPSCSSVTRAPPRPTCSSRSATPPATKADACATPPARNS